MPLRDVPEKKNPGTNVDESDSTEEGELSDGNEQSSLVQSMRELNGELHENDQERKLSGDKGVFPPPTCSTLAIILVELCQASMLTFKL